MSKNFFYLISFILLFLLTFQNVNAYCKDDNKDNSNKKVVYLTFDDAPGGDVTRKTLDILKDENVPATFFIIGNQIKGQEDIIIRMKDEGHSIGLHSFTHERNKLYGSCEGFINEMTQVQKALYDVTGENYYILRFPFGTNNSTYKISTEMANTVHSHGFKIYDWTQDTLDGANPTSSPDTILKRAISTNDTVVVLMHNAPANKTTAQAIRGIIKYYKSQGYTFKKITMDTPEIYHVIKR